MEENSGHFGFSSQNIMHCMPIKITFLLLSRFLRSNVLVYHFVKFIRLFSVGQEGIFFFSGNKGPIPSQFLPLKPKMTLVFPHRAHIFRKIDFSPEQLNSQGKFRFFGKIELIQHSGGHFRNQRYKFNKNQFSNFRQTDPVDQCYLPKFCANQ